MGKMLELDLRNNCVWAYRWFIKRQLLKLDVTTEFVIEEFNFAMKYIKRAIHNESPWNYLRSLFLSSGGCQRYHPQVRETDKSSSMYVIPSSERFTKGTFINIYFFVLASLILGTQLLNELEKLQNSDNGRDCPFNLNILAEAYEEEASEEGNRRALDILHRLVILDSERSIYWCRRAKRCEAKL